MPNMDGMELLRAIKAEAEFRDIPVVMQTAASEPEEVLEGIKAGVYYYLTKPYEQEMLLGIVGSALRDARSNKDLQDSVRRNRSILGLMVDSCFRTLDEAKNLAAYIANCFPEPERAIYGLHELLINAVEHGNLGRWIGSRPHTSALRVHISVKSIASTSLQKRPGPAQLCRRSLSRPAAPRACSSNQGADRVPRPQHSYLTASGQRRARCTGSWQASSECPPSSRFDSAQDRREGRRARYRLLQVSRFPSFP